MTVTPLEHPELAVHAESVDDALLDLSLALDDRIRRAHPRHLWRFAGSGEGQSGKLSSPGLRVWHGTSSSAVDVSLVTWQRPALQRMREVYLPTLGLRFWLQEQEEEGPVLGPVLKETLEKMPDTEVLRLALGGRAEFQVLTVESQPVQLAALKPDELHLDARPFRSREELAELAAEEDARQRRQRARADEKKRQERARRQTPTLKLLGVPLHTRAARARLEPVWERDAEVERLLAHIERERPQPLVLVAPHGSGKTALLEAMARKMGEPGGSRARRTRPVFLLDGSRLIAGTGGFGEWQRQLQESVEEARRSGAVLVLGRLVDLLDAGKSAHSDNNAAQVLAPVLASREVTVLAEATPEDWATVQRRNASFAGVWAPWRVEELGPEAVRRVLRQAALRLGERHRIVVHEEAEEEALALCRRFWPYGSLVGNVVTFLRRLVAARSHERAEAVRRLDVIEFFSVEAGIPASLLRDDVPLEPEEVRSFLGARVMAQPHAVERAVRVITMLKASLQDPRKPAAVLLFAGPTGVGKTELAKAIAELVFGSKERMIRVDMGEYLGPDALTRLLGDGDGDGLLPAQVRRQPFCVLLLDELEKAHPVVFDALLGVLGEGRLSDAEGRFTDFRNAIIIMTTNLGADTLRSRVGFGGGGGAGDDEAVRQHYLAEAQRFFRPEFFNRLDELVVFRPLGAEAIRAIVRREVDKIREREGLLRRDVTLQIGDGTLDLLASEGLDPRLGARPLKRTLERRLAVPAAAWLASHRPSGPTRLSVDGERAGAPLRFRAESLRRDAGGSRGQAEKLLEEAADLRALFSRWDRSPAATLLRSRLGVLQHSLRAKNFWDDTPLAEQISREVSVLQALVDPLAELRRGAEAAEDLAVEAWFDRRSDVVETLQGELDAMRERFQQFPRRIYLASHPRRTAAMLYLAGPRSVNSELDALLRVYLRWAASQQLTTALHLAEPIPDLPPNSKESDPDKLFRWRVGTDLVGTAPAAVALEVRGGPEVQFLQIEEGTHRFGSGPDSILHARFFPFDEGARARTLDLKIIMPLLQSTPEIRRYSRSKQSMKDLRLEEDIEMDLGTFDLGVFHERWIERSCLEQEELSWS